ncbi:MAG: hypothetical protein DIJKHBIC_03404 [Thermoanaerobaculia bacterium]|nr:hypothetical protein [Thermoanaerobaculia bacterium]
MTFLTDEGEPIQISGPDVAPRLASGKVTMKSWIGSCEDLIFSMEDRGNDCVEWYSLTYLESRTAMSFGNALLERFRLRAASGFEDILIWDWTGASEDLDWLSLTTSTWGRFVIPDVLGLPTRLWDSGREPIPELREEIERTVLMLSRPS